MPVGEFEAETVAHYARWLQPASQRLIAVATRRVGLMLGQGDPKKIYGLRDLARPEVRFINRQPGSGTRFLLDMLLRREGVEPAQIHGYEQCELTHAAVAAYVASGMADVGLGVETPARQFKLDFVPLQTERYFLLCEARSLERPAVRELLAIVGSDRFKATVNALPGYQADAATGSVTDLQHAFPTVAVRRRPRAKKPA